MERQPQSYAGERPIQKRSRGIYTKGCLLRAHGKWDRGSRLRELVAKAPFRPNDALESIASAPVKRDRHERIHASFRNGCSAAMRGHHIR
jgi:hypothetical protein